MSKPELLHERLERIFGADRLRTELRSLYMNKGHDPLWHLTDEAIDVLKYRLVSDLKLQRKFNAASRAHYAAQQKRPV